MNAALGIAGVLVCLAALMYFWCVSFLPRLGSTILRHATTKRLVLAALGLSLATVGALEGNSVPSWIAVGVAGVFTAAILIVQPQNIFATLARTDHVAADSAGLADEIEVMGLAVAGHAVAWPILDMLAPRHIVNDVVGGQAVMATYCPACRSGMVFSRTVGGATRTFSVAGLWRKNMVAIDAQTGSLWQQATGEGLAGPLAKEQLEILFAEQSTWAAWRTSYPATELAVAPKDAHRSIVPERVFRRLAMEATKSLALPGLRRPDERLAPHDEVAGLKLGDIFKAYPIDAVQAAGEVRDQVGSLELVLTWDPNARTVRATAGGMPVHVQRHWWLSWSEFYPHTELWQSGHGARPVDV